MCALLTFFAANVLRLTVGDWVSGVASYIVSAMTGLIMLGLTASSVVLGILGLVEFGQSNGRYTQGRAQAIWAFVLSGICCLLLVGGFVASITRSQLPPAFSGQPATAVTNVALNFRYRAPSNGWVQWDVSNFNKDAQFAFMRRKPEVYLMGIMESLGSESQINNSGLASLAFAQLKSVFQDVQEISREPLVVNGMCGLLVEYEAETSHRKVHYVRWYCVTNGWGCQLIGWGNALEGHQVNSEVRQAITGFELLDPEKHAPRTGAFEADFVSAHHQYKALVSQTAWGKFATLGKDFPEAEFGAVRASTEAMAVVPIWLAGQEMSEEALTYGLLSTMNIPPTDPNLTRRRQLDEGGFQGVQYDFQREISGREWIYRIRCIKRGEFAYLVAAWTLQDNPNPEAFFSDAFARLSFSYPLASIKPALTDLSARERKTRGHVMNEAGIQYFRMRDYEKAVSLFREAASSFAEEPTYVLNAVQSWNHLDQPKVALEYLEAHAEVVRKAPELRAYQALFQAQSGMLDRAITNYSALFASGFRDDNHFTEYVSRLTEEQRYDVAQQEVGRYLAAKDSVAVRLVEAEIYRAQKDYSQAIKLLQIQHEKAPFNPQIANTLTEVLIEANRCNEALALSKKSLQNCADSAYPMFLKGRAEFGLKWYREAKESFEAALKLAPTSTTAREYLNVVSGILGEGSNSAIKQAIAQVPLPSCLTNSAACSAPPDCANDFGAYYSRRVTAVQFVPRRECRTTDYLFLNVLDSAGVTAFSTIQVSFDPTAEEIFVNELSVFDDKGTLVSTGKVSDYYVIDENSEDTATHRKTLNIPIPGLRPGCEVRLIITRSELGRIEEFPQFQYLLARTIPTCESAIFISGDTKNLKFGTSPGTSERSVPEGRLWLVKNPPVARHEPMQPPMATYLPELWITDRDATWTAVATNYLDTIHDRLEPDAATRAQGALLVKGLTNEQSRLEAILRHVQTNYTYKAIEFGRRARIPNRPADISHNKYGDCKDHSLLLAQLLEGAGIPARLALVAYGGIVQKDFPSLDQFNHMIVYLPGVHGGQFVDCTDKGCDAGHAIPYGLARSEALILDGLQSRFVSIPESQDIRDEVEVRRKLAFTSSVDATVEECITLKGTYSAMMRSWLLQIPATARRNVLQRQFARDTKDTGEFNLSGLEVPGADMQITVSYPLHNTFRQESGDFTGVIRPGMERPYLETDAISKRLSPFEILLPMNFRAQVEIAPPPGFTVQMLPSLPPKLDARFGTFESRTRIDHNTLILEVVGRQGTGKFPPQDYVRYQESMAQALSLLERGIVLKSHGTP
jgi:tetratricopeptide (TPR) repeat protein